MRVARTSSVEFWLTVAGLWLAVSVLIVVLGVEGGFADRIERARLSSRGDVVRIIPPDIRFEGPDGREYRRVVLGDTLDTILDRVTMGQEIAACTPIRITPPKRGTQAASSPAARPDDQEGLLSYVAVTQNYFRLMGLKVSEGRLWDADEAERRAEVAVLGYGLGQYFRLGSVVSVPSPTESNPPDVSPMQEFSVLGILAETGNAYPVLYYPGTDHTAMSGLDYTAFMPLGSIKHDWVSPFVRKPGGGGPRDVGRSGLELVVRPAPGRESESVEEILNILESLGFAGAEVRPESQAQQIYSRVSKNISRLFLYVALVCLGLSGVNLANLLLMRVIRESRYIGIRRATGASRLTIMRETTQTSLTVACLGALGGLALSFPARAPLSELVGQACRVDWKSASLGTALLEMVALLAAAYPAWKAARSEPAEMIRSGLLPPSRRRLRVDARDVVAALGLAVGIAAVASIFALGESARMDVERYLRAVGQDVLIVREPDPFVTGHLESRLTPDFADAIEDVPGVETLGWQEWGRATVRRGDKSRDCTLVACDLGLLEVKRLGIRSGSPPSAGALVLGYALADALFGAEEAVGRSVEVNGIEFAVAGVLEKRPPDMLDQSYDRDNAAFVLWTPDVSESAFASVWSNREFWVKAREGAFGDVKARLESLVFSGGFRLAVPVGELSELRSTTRDVTRVLSVLAALGVLIGTAGISSLMYVRVAEEARLIGIRRAVGATRKDIALSYLARTVMVCVRGGLLGMAISLLSVWGVSSAGGWPAGATWKWAGLALGTSVLAGLLAGWLPASRAASLSPVEAIRHE